MIETYQQYKIELHNNSVVLKKEIRTTSPFSKLVKYYPYP
jgi:hypothetical protein